MFVSLLKEKELFWSVIIPYAIGMGLKFDGAKMKLFKANSTVQSSEIIVKSVCAITPGGEKQLAAPILSQLILDY